MRTLRHSSPRGIAWAIIGVLVLLPGDGAIARSRPQTRANPAATTSKDWRRVSSTHFVAEGDASDKDLRTALLHLESFRAALGHLHPGITFTSAVPSRIVVFKGPNAFDRFRPRDVRGRPMPSVSGYFTAGPDASYIVLGSYGGTTTYATILHEYTHYVVQRNIGQLPLWLNEGLAEFYSTFELMSDGRALVGRPPDGRLRQLRATDLRPLREILNPRGIDGMWQIPDMLMTFYAESWAFVHYLLLGRQETPKPIAAYMDAARRSASVDETLTVAFGVDAEKMLGELRQYVWRPRFEGLILTIPADVSGAHEVVEVTELTERIIKAELLLMNRATEEAEKELAPVAALADENAEVGVVVGRLRLQQDRRDEGLAALTHAAQIAPSRFAAQFYLGTALADAGRHEDALNAFDRAIAINPAAPAPWLGLSTSALALGRDAQSNATFKRAVELYANGDLYRTRAYEALALGRNAVALADARSYIQQIGWGDEQAQYAALAAVIAALRLGDAPAADTLLEQLDNALADGAWTSQVVQFLRGRFDGAQLLARARGNGQMTEAHAYMGFKAEIDGRRDDALMHLQWVVDRGARNYIEYNMAKKEIARIKHSPQ